MVSEPDFMSRDMHLTELLFTVLGGWGIMIAVKECIVLKFYLKKLLWIEWLSGHVQTIDSFELSRRTKYFQLR